MNKILLVKITSMGDLIQMLPALTDAAKAIPGIQFDWLVEESFQEIPRLHPTVDKVIALPYRRWKKNKIQAIQQGEVSAFLQQARSEPYDSIIDAQSNFKSAFVSMLAKGRRYGLDGKSVREYGAHWAYHKKISISRLQNHALRLRQMLASLLDYELPHTPPDYGIIQSNLPALDFLLPERFIFIVPIASCANKLWPEAYWQEVIQDLIKSGYEILIPWWSKEEKERAIRLKNNRDPVHLLPQLNLAQKATVLTKAQAAISVDTGLAHMAAALNIPNVCLYGPTNPEHCGTYGYKQVHLSSGTPTGLEAIKPQAVLEAFYKRLV
ncbi:MAG: lipopolysaccharide heptosyltransferase I [Legionellales bacterium]